VTKMCVVLYMFRIAMDDYVIDYVTKKKVHARHAIVNLQKAFPRFFKIPYLIIYLKFWETCICIHKDYFAWDDIEG